jgi:hypothetical protein
MNAARYRNEILTPCLNQLHDDESVYGYFQQNGATVHTTGATIEFLAEFYNRIISCNTPNNWPPRSCDLTPCDFFLWPHIKNLICTTPINYLAELRKWITPKINEINNNPIVLENVTNGIRQRTRWCLQEQGTNYCKL